MLLTITTTAEPASDLGFLLHKHPGRVQAFDVSVGTAHVFYPQVGDARTTAALLLEVDPVGLVRGRQGPPGEGFALGQYVNDRPYAASSMLAVAIKEVFRTALTGRCVSHQTLADSALPLELHVPALPCRGGIDLARRVFEPLGWQVAATAAPLDPAMPGWGDSRYLDIRLAGTVRLADALNHLYVLLPVLDDGKHYWVSTDEVDKLVRAGGDWLAGHPEKELITRRYLAHKRELTRDALARLAEVDDLEPEDLDNALDGARIVEAPDHPAPLSEQRRGAVLAAIRAAGARRVGDLGCGEGVLVRDLLADHAIERVVATDVSARALQVAARRLKLDSMSERARERLQIFQSSLTYRDDRLAGLDAAVLMEVIEHIDPARLAALERVVFAHAAPSTVIVTTPNVEYNVRYETLPPGTPRHRDHRFEWTRGQFRDWAGAGGGAPRVPRAVPARGRGRPRGRPADPDGGLRQDRGRDAAAADRPGGGTMTELGVPELSLVVLVGVSGSGKSTFARERFKPTEVISSDFCRGIVADDENDQSATADAFELLHFIVGKRLAAGRLTVVDATNVQLDARRSLVALAREHDVLPVAIVLDVPESVCRARNASRPDRDFGEHVIRRQHADLRRSLRGLQKEGFRTVHVLRGEEEIAAATITRTRLFNDLRHEAGPFDVIGDIHGCAAELQTLLGDLGYVVRRDELGRATGASHPDRRAIFVGDLVDRGPDTPGVLRLVMGMVGAGDAFCVPGNHENKLVRALRGRKVQVTHGLAESLAQLAAEPAEFRAEAERFMDGLVSHYVFDDGKLVVVPRRADRAVPRTRVGPGARVLPVRADDGRDRRVRAAGALPVGQRVPGTGDGPLRPHPGARAGVGQQHHVPGHRLRVRRQAHRAALPGAGNRLRPRGAGLLRAGQAVPCQPDREARHRSPLTASPRCSTSAT